MPLTIEIASHCGVMNLFLVAFMDRRKGYVDEKDIPMRRAFFSKRRCWGE